MLVSRLSRLGSSDVGMLMEEWWRGLLGELRVGRVGYGVQVGEDGG